ncbi:hypothetical protein BS78_K334600 [Paspalum vaginatum]|uniref:AAA+ ATPase domain-containing protein n=1 Tax=Paspalum vaginatum TaxID=158149 RepID=A0A9W8CEP8_9POAL|nr:hypothetical protein BS78_K334600 [Paspalum vaginatum]
MADLVMGAMGSLIPKLGELLKEEYDLQTGVKDRITMLTKELEGAQVALHKVAQVPRDQLDEQVKLWAREVRELSYDMEDVIDKYLVRVQQGSSDPVKKERLLRRLGDKMTNLFKKSKARHEIGGAVKDIMTHLDEVTKRCQRFKVDDIVVKPTAASTVDPRLAAMYSKVENLVAIDKSSSELISMLQTTQHLGGKSPKMKIVSVVGVGGLGKTTLAKAVYDQLKGDFNCRAFVPVGRNPDLKKVFKGILIELDKERYKQFNFGLFDEVHQFINELRDFLLQNKRYFIVIDDIWEIQSWDIIKLAFDDDDNCGGRVIITTRKLEVATKASEVYKLPPLPYDSSRELFYARMYHKGSHVGSHQPDEITDKILKKCGGIPLAIIAMSSLLVGKPKDKWSEIFKTIGFGRRDSEESENTTMKILSFSYYDLPLHLRTCLLYLSAFPEDSVIPKTPLIWMWIAEGFIREEKGIWLYEVGERYFNDLANRSLIQVVEEDEYTYDVQSYCRVHDIVLDFIRSMSHEENFFTISDNDQDTPLHNNARRLAHHNRTMGYTHQAYHSDGMRAVRSFSAQRCAIESWVPLSSFTLLRVLAIENCNPTYGCRISVEHIGHLHHLRYLSLSGTEIDKVPEEIRALRFLQTLDLSGSSIEEAPSSNSFPTQLVCLRISYRGLNADDAMPARWLERLTSLEELFIFVRWRMKELGSLRELRVLIGYIFGDDEESERYFMESICHLDKLQHLVMFATFGTPRWKGAGLVLPRHLRKFCLSDVWLVKLPSCINPSALPYLSHLDLILDDMDDQDLKILGSLPELYFLGLGIRRCSAAIISNVSDGNNACYFPKLSRCRLRWSMFLFLANEEDTKKRVSFHLWDGQSDIDVPFGSNAASDDGNKLEDSILVNQGTAAATRFMPSLQDLRFDVDGKAAEDHRYCDNLGLEYLSSLRKIRARISGPKLQKVEEALRRAVDRHPNRPALSIK